MRKKAWERRRERGLATQIAQHLTLKRPQEPTSAQTVRRWLLDPEHPDRRRCADAAIRKILAKKFDLEPNDFEWLPGEKSQRRREALEEARL